MAEDADAGELFRPVIEVFLIGKTIGFDEVVAPLVAPFPPPFEAREPIGVPAKGKKSYVVDAVAFTFVEMGGEAMADDQDRPVPHFRENRLRVGKEVEIGVEVGDLVDLRVPVEEAERQGGTEGEIVLDSAPVFFCTQELGVSRLQLG